MVTLYHFCHDSFKLCFFWIHYSLFFWVHCDCPYVLQEGIIFIRLQKYWYPHFKYEKLGLREMLLDALLTWRARFVMSVDWSLWALDIFVTLCPRFVAQTLMGRAFVERRTSLLGSWHRVALMRGIRSLKCKQLLVVQWRWDSLTSVLAVTSSALLFSSYIPTGLWPYMTSTANMI